MARSKRWEGLAFRPLGEPGREARELFGFVGAWVPPSSDVVAGVALDDPARQIAQRFGKGFGRHEDGGGGRVGGGVGHGQRSGVLNKKAFSGGEKA